MLAFNILWWRHLLAKRLKLNTIAQPETSICNDSNNISMFKWLNCDMVFTNFGIEKRKNFTLIAVYYHSCGQKLLKYHDFDQI